MNGQVWYPVAGGMQDWNYFNTGAFEVTVELGCIKFPDEKYIQDYWEANREATLQFIEQTQIGVRGVVLDHNGDPLQGAEVRPKNQAT